MLSKSDKRKIREVIKKGTNARVISRAHVLYMRLKLELTAIEVAESLQITVRTVFNIVSNYNLGGIEKALYDDSRPGAPIQFDQKVKTQIVALVCSDPPEGFDRWTLDLIVKESVKRKIVESIHRDTIRVILREHDLKPWTQKSWCIPKLDDEFIERMNDVLKVYERSPDKKKPLVCIDEKSVQLTKDIRSPEGLSAGRVKRVDYEYKREGVANIFCAVLPKEGVYINRVTEQRTRDDFAKFLASIERRYEGADKIVLVMDNLNTHSKKSLVEFYGEDEGGRIWNRFEIHYTPKHGSWLNQAEIAINIYGRQCLGKSRIPNIEVLRKKTKFWNKAMNRRKVKIQWKFTRKKAQEKFRL